MKKKVFGRYLSRERDTRRALFRSLTRALVLYGKIETTKAKAKAVIPFIENLVKTLKKDSLAARRKAIGNLANDKVTIGLLTKNVLPGLEGKTVYTKITPLPVRRGDSADMVRLEWSGKMVTVNETGSKQGGKDTKNDQKDIKSKTPEGKKKIPVTMDKTGKLQK